MVGTLKGLVWNMTSRRSASKHDKVGITFINIFAPTGEAEDEAKDEFYKN